IEVSIDAFTLYCLELVPHKAERPPETVYSVGSPVGTPDLREIQLCKARSSIGRYRYRYAPSRGKLDVEKDRASQSRGAESAMSIDGERRHHQLRRIGAGAHQDLVHPLFGDPCVGRHAPMRDVSRIDE